MDFNDILKSYAELNLKLGQAIKESEEGKRNDNSRTN